MKEQKIVYSVADLRRMQKAGENREMINGQRHCLVSGTLLRPNFFEKAERGSSEKQREYLHKHLGRDYLGKALIDVTALQYVRDQSFVPCFRSYMLESSKVRECLLVDENAFKDSPAKSSMAVAASAGKLQTVFNLFAKKKFMHAYSEEAQVVKYAAAEGQGVTLLGLVKYDPDTDTFAMTEVASVLGGGLRAALNQFSEHLRLLRIYMTVLFVSGMTSFCLGAIRYYGHYRTMRNRLDREEALRKASEKALANNKLVAVSTLEEGRAECSVCYSQPATFVYVPCNHMFCCEQCAETVR